MISISKPEINSIKNIGNIHLSLMSSSVGKHVVFIYCLYCHDKETSYRCHQYFVSMMIIFVSTRCTMSETFISILFATIHIYWSWICMVKPPPSKFVNKIFLLYCKNFGDLKFCMVLFLTEIKIIPLFFASNVGIFFQTDGNIILKFTRLCRGCNLNTCTWLNNYCKKKRSLLLNFLIT